MLKRIIFLTAVFLLITACVPQDPEYTITLASTPTIVTPSPPVIISTDTPLPSMTSTPMKVIEASPSPTATTETEVADVCQATLNAQFEPGVIQSGSIIFEGECDDEETELFKLSSGARQIEPYLENISHKEYVGPYHVSNNGEWLAFETYFSGDKGVVLENLVIANEDASSVMVYPISENWWDSQGWYKDNLLGIKLAHAPRATWALLDPFTGDLSSLYTEYFWMDSRDAKYSIDSTMERSLFFDDFSIPMRYVLKDVVTEQEIWQSSENQYFSRFEYPEWAPDGSRFALAYWITNEYESYQIVVVSRNGEEIIIDKPVKSDGPTGYTYGWSPSGKYLAFWGQEENDTIQLLFWDVETEEIIETGISAPNDSLPIFSPDERQFILQIYTDEVESERQTIVVDAVTMEITQIDLDLLPRAWLRTHQSQEPVSGGLKETEAVHSTPSSSIQTLCPETCDPTEIELDFVGGIVFFSEDYPYTITASDGIRELPNGKPNKTYRPAYISTDRKWLFYYHTEPITDSDNQKADWSFWLTSLDGQQTKEVVTREGDYTHGWFDEQNVWLEEMDDSILLFNPFEETKKGPAAKGEFIKRGCIDWSYCTSLAWPLSFYIFETSFERLIYVSAPAFGGVTPSINMKDLDGNILWEMQHWLAADSVPKWSPDEQLFAIALPTDEEGFHYELFLVDRNGEASQVTNFNQEYPGTVIDSIQWSPDGRQIAFWMDTRSGSNKAQTDPYRLFIVDIQSQQVTDYCVMGNYLANKSPIWSPDGRQIAITSNIDGTAKIFLVNMDDNYLTELTEGELIGWMIMP